MKRTLVSILLLVYFTVSTGFAVSLHYCMDRLASAEIGAHQDEECGRCGMHVKKSGGCCRDEVKVVKLAADHFAAQVKQILQPPVLTLAPLPGPLLLPDLLLEPFTPVSLAHGPPPSPPEPIYLRNRVFRL